MKSNLINQNHAALIKLNKKMSPRQRLMAFYRHSQLLAKLALAGQRTRKKSAQKPS